MLRTTLLLFAVFVASYDCSIISDIANTGNPRIRMESEHRNTQIGEGVRDLFRNTRGKFFGKDSSNQGNIPSLVGEELEQTKVYKRSDIPKRLLIQTGNFLFDLSNLKFEPKDWGFHVGNWYIIRKLEPGEEDLEDWSDFKEFIDGKEELKIQNFEESNDDEEEGDDKAQMTTIPSSVSAVALTAVTDSVEEEETGMNDDAMKDLSMEVLNPPA